MNSPIKKLLATEMNRKQFLSYAGATALTVVGVKGLIQAVTGPAQRQTGGGYGGDSYGGNRDQGNSLKS